MHAAVRANPSHRMPPALFTCAAPSNRATIFMPCAYSMLSDRFKLCLPFYSGGAFSPWGEGPSVFDRFGDLKSIVYGFYGNDDKNPSPADVDKFDARLTELGVEHKFYRYEGAGHAFQNTVNRDNYRPKQSEDAWEKVIRHLKDHLLG